MSPPQHAPVLEKCTTVMITLRNPTMKMFFKMISMTKEHREHTEKQLKEHRIGIKSW